MLVLPLYAVCLSISSISFHLLLPTTNSRGREGILYSYTVFSVSFLRKRQLARTAAFSLYVSLSLCLSLSPSLSSSSPTIPTDSRGRLFINKHGTNLNIFSLLRHLSAACVCRSSLPAALGTSLSTRQSSLRDPCVYLLLPVNREARLSAPLYVNSWCFIVLTPRRV